MQTSLFSQEQVNKESGVGELVQGSSNFLEDFSYLRYPELEELLVKVKDLLAQNKRITFKTKKVFPNSDLGNDFLNTHALQNKDAFDGLMATHFGALLTQNIAGQKVLGQYSLAYIEAKASAIYHKHFFGEKRAIDHFYFAKGICSPNVLDDVIRSYELPSNCPPIILLPNNAIKAFRNTAYAGWQFVEVKSKEASSCKAYQVNKDTQDKTCEIKLVEEEYTNINLPIYKLKIGDGWAITIPWQVSYASLCQDISLKIDNNLINSIKEQKNIENDEEEQEEVCLEVSLGQAARIIFELIGADFELLPELMINFEGGSWSSIALENSSSGRHNGTNSMHEVLSNGWHKHKEIAIPWFYLGFDKLTEQNKHLLEDDHVFQINFNGVDMIEAPQGWKKSNLEMVQYITKFVYREFSNIGSKKFLLSAKELMQVAAKFLANWSINNYESETEAYKEGIKALNINDDFVELLELLTFTHLLSSSKADFYSCKTHPSSISRLRCIAKIQKKLEQLSPVSAKNFSRKIYALLSKDCKTEFTTLWDLYQSELNKL